MGSDKIPMLSKLLYVISFTIGTLSAWAAPNTLTYQGRIIKSDGQPLEYSNVSFVFEITSPNGNCVIYREQKDGINMLNSKGVFDVPIGSGSKLFPTDPVFTLSKAFDNSITQNCFGGSTYTPISEDIRVLKVQFHDGSGWKVIDPPNIIRSVPFAHHAHSAQTIGGFTADDLLVKSQTPGAACSVGQVITFDGSNFVCVADQGGAGVVTSVSGSGPVTVTGTGNITVGLNVGTTAGTVAAGNDSRLTGAFQASTSLGGDLSGTLPNPTVAKLQGQGVSSTAPTNGQVLKFNSGASQWQPVRFGVDDLMSEAGLAQFASANCASNQTLTWSSITDVFTCANISISESNISGTISGTKISGSISGNAAGFTGALNGDVSGTQGATSVDKIKGRAINLTGLADGQVLRWNNTANEWQASADSNSGGTITSLTGDVTASGTGAVAATIATNAITSAKIADGTIVDADISTSAAIADTKLATITTSGKVANSATTGTASSVADSLVLRDSSGNFAANAVSFSSLEIRNASANKVTVGAPSSFTNYALTLPSSAGTPGQVLTTNGAGVLSWTAPSAGTVTAVSASSPLTVSSPTSTPQVSISAGSGDGQVLRWNTTNWSSSYLNFADLKSTAGLRQIPGTCTNAQTLVWQSASDTFACADISLAATQVAGVFTQGGNSFGAAAVLGTNDNQSLSFKTNNTTHLTLLGTGQVGLGTALPQSPLHISNDSAGITADRYNDLPGYAGYLSLSHFRGTESTPQTLVGGDMLGQVRFRGYTRNAANTADAAVVLSSIDANVESTNLNRANTNLEFATSTSSSRSVKMTISSSGNVGIGTGTPAVALDIGSKADAIRLPAGNDAQRPGTPANGMIRYNSVSNKFEAYENGTWINMIGGAAASANSVTAATGSAAAPSISFSGDPDTGFFNSSSDNTISVTAGASKVFDISAAGLVSDSTGGGLVSSANGTAASPTFSFAGDPDTGWFRPAADTLAAATAGNERIRITSSGLVGVGTSAPAGMVHSQISETGYGFLVTDSSATGSLLSMGEGGSTANTFNPLINARPVGANRFLGIYSDLQNGEDTGTSPIMVLAGRHNTSSVSTRPILEIRNNTTALVNVSAGGNVGIGNTSPQEKLHVSGDILTSQRVAFQDNARFTVTPTQVSSLAANYSMPQYGIAAPSTGAAADLWLAGYNGIRMFTFGSPTPRLNITSTGYIGVGTTTPQRPFHVAQSAPAGGNVAPMMLERINTSGTPGINELTMLQFKMPNSAGTSIFSADLGATLIDVTPGSEKGALVFRVSDDGGATVPERVRITSEGLMVNTFTSGGAKLAIAESRTNAATAFGINVRGASTATANGTYYAIGVENNVTKVVNSGVTDSGYLVGMRANTMRNFTAANDRGTLNEVTGISSQYGHYSFDASTPTTTNAYGVRVTPYAQTGTIDSMYDFFAGDPIGTGTVNNRYGLYIGGVNKKNFIHGNLGVGTNSPSYRLHADVTGTGAVAGFSNTNGTCTITPNTASLSCSSDIRLKEDIERILGLDALNKVLQLQAHTYRWKNGDDQHYIGYLAQEAEKVVPELVTTGTDGYKQVSYSGFVPLLSEALKELNNKVELQKRGLASEDAAMKAEIQTLKEENQALKQALGSLEERLRKLEAAGHQNK